MPYQHWFVSRQKRQLTSILEALIAFSDVCVGKVWDTSLQLVFEDALGSRQITVHGGLRARKENMGGGGTRTLFKQMKDLGLVFYEDTNRKCRLTLIGEELVKGKVSFVEAMRLQLQRYQYPSAAVWSGSGSVDHSFKVHPFQFLFRLLLDPRLDNTITMEEMAGIVIHKARTDANDCFDDVVARIIAYRAGDKSDLVTDTQGKDPKTFLNIANTFFNYIDLTQFVERGFGTLHIRKGREQEARKFAGDNPKFIPNPDLTENYQRKFGRGRAAKDLRNFDDSKSPSQKELNEERIRKEYVLTALTTPITGITPDIVQRIAMNTGISDKTVEHYLVQTYPHGNIDDFFVSYKELAHMGTSGATEFEKATCEMFRKIFHMKARHVGSIGNTPDVFVESEDENFCGIIDNKAYKNGYSISGDHQRVMEDVYIPTYRLYGDTQFPLAFFTYIAGSFGKNINDQLQNIKRPAGVNCSAMPVDILINLAQDYAAKGYDHNDLRAIFSVNREVQLADLKAT